MERFLNTGEAIDLETHTLTRCKRTLADPDCILVSLLEIEGPHKPLYFHVNDESHMQVATNAPAVESVKAASSTELAVKAQHVPTLELAIKPKAVC